MVVYVKRGSKGPRVVRFKDFCYQDVGDTLPYYMWAQHTLGGTWSIESGTQPYDSIDGYGNSYKGNMGSALSGTLHILNSITTNATWASTTQSVNSKRTAIQYDVAMKIDASSNGAWFIFEWNTSSSDHYAYAVALKQSEIALYKISGGDLATISNWTKIATGTANPDSGTWYWFRIAFVPEDVVEGGRTIGLGGTFVILVDTAHRRQGLGLYDQITYTDTSSRNVVGTKLGLGAAWGGVSNFTGIEFCEDWMGQSRYPVAVNKFLLFKSSSHLMFSLAVMQEEYCKVAAGDRIEMWIAGADESGNGQRVCDFDGKVLSVDMDSSHKRAFVYAVDEGFELARTYRTHDPSTAATYATHIKGTILTGRAGGSRIPFQGIDTSVLTGNPSDDWNGGSGSDMSDADMIEFACILYGAIQVWTPEGYLVCTNYIPYTFTIDNTEDSPPQPIVYYKVWDDMGVFHNSMAVKAYGGTVTSNDTTSQAAYGKITKRELWPGAPAADAGTYSDKQLGTFKDRHPFVRVGLLNFVPQLQLGCIVNVTLSTYGMTSVPMMVVEKSYWNGDWKGGPPDGPNNTVIYTLSYCDPTASPFVRARLPFGDLERFKEWTKQYVSDRKTQY